MYGCRLDQRVKIVGTSVCAVMSAENRRRVENDNKAEMKKEQEPNEMRSVCLWVEKVEYGQLEVIIIALPFCLFTPRCVEGGPSL